MTGHQMILEATEHGYEEVIRHRDAEIARLRAQVSTKNEALEDIAKWADEHDEPGVFQIAQYALAKE